MDEMKKGVSRRHFIETAAITGAGLTIVPRHVLGRGYTPPSDLLNIACVGIGGMGRNNMRAVASQNVVAVCDVDWDYAGKSIERFTTDLERRRNPPPPAAGQPAPRPQEPIDDPARQGEPLEVLQRLVDQLPKAKRYSDYREMLAQQKDIDAVIVATPDHMHAAIASAAMDLGKHVYVQKPLCWSVEEARLLARKARDNRKLATQMGNQGHSHAESRTTVEYIQDGAIGDVREVHVWTNRPLGYWPQGLPRPKPMRMNAQGQPPAWNGRGVEQRLADAMFADYPIPDTLKWDLFLGVAPQVDYHPVYHPFNWRGWVDWGQGALGDMGAHLIDFPFWALDLGMPTSVETISTPFNDVCFPNATTTYFEFAARGSRPAVKMTWYDGGLLPPRPAEFSDEMIADRQGRMIYKDEVNKDGGVMFVGSKGKLMHETYGYKPRLLPQSLHDAFGKPKPRLPRIQTTHEMNWVDAAKGTTQASSPFEYAARLVEVMLLGVVSLRARTKIYYDAGNMRITNATTANDLLRREYRNGFKLT